jgi:hypothetical protein
MSLVNLKDTDIFLNKLTFVDGTSQSAGLNPTNLTYYNIPPVATLTQGIWNVAQTTDAFDVGIYLVHYKAQVYTPDNNAMTNIQMECIDSTTTTQILGSQFVWNVETSNLFNCVRSIDKTMTFFWNNLTVGNTFTLQTNVVSLQGGVGFTYTLATGGVVQLIKIG